MLVSTPLDLGMSKLSFRLVSALPESPVSFPHVADIHFSTCRDFLLKQELLRAISDLGFEHPSEGEYCLFVCSSLVMG